MNTAMGGATVFTLNSDGSITTANSARSIPITSSTSPTTPPSAAAPVSGFTEPVRHRRQQSGQPGGPVFRGDAHGRRAIPSSIGFATPTITSSTA